MGLGVISGEEFDLTVKSLEEKVVRKVNNVRNFVGRGTSKEVPAALRKIIAEESLQGAGAAELSETFNVSESSVSAYKNGSTSTASYDEPDPELNQHITGIKEEITGAARLRLSQAINHITDEKLAAAKLKDVASVAKDMSAVIRNMEPDKINGNQVTQFIYFAPKQRDESQYKVIDVTD